MTNFSRTLSLLALSCGVLASACSQPRERSSSPEQVRDGERARDGAPAAEQGAPGLDGALARAWAAAGVEPAPIVDDASFLRRVTLDVIGRVPREDEVRRFLADEGPDKRARVVDELLASDAFAEHWGDVYADLLVGVTTGQERRVHGSTQAWLAEQFRTQRPYDEMVAELLTTSGEADMDDPGAAGFLFAKGRKGRIENLAGETSRVFLGVQIACAQCHDHPYDDRYTQRDFYGMAAYFARSRVRRGKKGAGQRSVRIIDRPRGEAFIPTPEGEPGEMVAPRFLGTPLVAEGDETRREALVRAMRGSELLAKAAVNRTWWQLLGRGVVEPYDDLGGEGDEHPPVLETLSAEFREGGYDMRALIKTIALSSAYQRASTGDVADPKQIAAAERVFARAAVRPLSSRQLFSSMIVATGLEDSDNRVARRLASERRENALREYLFLFNDDEMGAIDSFDGNVPQALLLLNGDLTNRGVTIRAGGTVKRALDGYAQASSDADARAEGLSRLYLATYGRPPSDAEREGHADFLARAGDSAAAYEDLLFALMLSSEFVTNH